MMRKFCILLLCALSCMTATAAQLTLEQARIAVEQFMNNRDISHGTAMAATASQVKPLSVCASDRAAVYAVNLGDNEGFVLVGGTDSANGRKVLF